MQILNIIFTIVAIIANATLTYLAITAWFELRRLKFDILPRLKPRDSWVLTPPHGYLSRLPRLTRTPQ